MQASPNSFSKVKKTQTLKQIHFETCSCKNMQNTQKYRDIYGHGTFDHFQKHKQVPIVFNNFKNCACHKEKSFSKISVE